VSPVIEVCDHPQEAARRVAEIFADAIRSHPDIVLGLATGGTPVGVYAELVRMHREGSLDFSQLTTFNLDEYVGLAPDHPQSYRYFMQQNLFDHVNVRPDKTHVPDGLAADIAQHALEYESQIREVGGVDLQLLGIGDNGHIAFNEPGSSPDSRTRQVDLTEETIRANSRFFESVEEVPRHAITMGIGTILEAKRIVLMATGARKSEAVERAIQGPIDPLSPASQLQRAQDVTFVLDAAAASRLSV
jgi:glucosamine-6-phosphate deaminase